MKYSTLSIVGLGKLGASFAACLAAKGFRVIGLDVDPQRFKVVADYVALGVGPSWTDVEGASS